METQGRKVKGPKPLCGMAADCLSLQQKQMDGTTIPRQILRKKCDNVKTKLFAILLVLALLIQSPIAALAAGLETLPEGDSITTSETGTNTEPTNEESTEATDPTETTDATDPTDNTVPVDVGTGSSSGVQQPTVNEQEGETAENAEIVNFEVQIQNDFPRGEELGFLNGNLMVTLERKVPATEGTESEGVEASATDDHYHAAGEMVDDNLIVFRAVNVPAGTYEMGISGRYYFQNFKQDVTITEGTKTTLVFSNSYASYRGDGKTSPGVFALGDVNGDGLIDETDAQNILMFLNENKTILVNPDLENEETPAEEPAPTEPAPVEKPNGNYQEIYDLNLDGKIDIQDLSILAYNMNQEKREATSMLTILPSAVTVKTEEVKATVVEDSKRSLETIMEDAKDAEDVITLAPANADEPISEANPIEIPLALPQATEIGGMVISAPADSGPTGGTIKVETVDPDSITEENPEGNTIFMEVPIVNEAGSATPEQPATASTGEEENENQPAAAPSRTNLLRRTQMNAVSTHAKAIRKADGTIEINLGKQIAIKKVTIVVTATAKSLDLVDIAKVEFLNDMETRIPEPELNIPHHINISGKGESFTVTWAAETNVAGYVVKIYATYVKDGKTITIPVCDDNIFRAGVNRLEVSSFKGGVKDKVTPLYTYYVQIQSVNGKWSSPWSEVVSHYQMAGKAPDAPDNVKVNGKYRQLDVSWKDMPGTEKYTLEYREKGTEEFTAVHDIYRNSYSILELKDGVTYEVRVYGWNTDDNGNPRRGPNSLPAIGKTTSDRPNYPRYGMITRDEIESVRNRWSVDATKYPEGVTFNPEFMIDDDFTTYFHSTGGADIGATVTFKEEMTLKEIVVTNRMEDGYGEGGNYFRIYITAVAENGTRQSVGCSVQRLGAEAKNTVRYILDRAVNAKTIEFGVHRYYNAASTISEIKFFKYNSLEDDVNGLFADDMHATLREEGVSQDDIDTLRERLTVKDETWDEYHPKKSLLESELDLAEQLLKDGMSQPALHVKFDITTQGVGNSQVGGGLTGFQPLGYVAGVGDTIKVYVGQKGKKVGDATDVGLVFTQYHPEAAAWKSGTIALKQGVNEITIPKVHSLDFEAGGSLYIVHSNMTNVLNNPIDVRVTGATKIPTLELHRTIGNSRASIDETAWKDAIRTYVNELVAYVGNLANSHNTDSKHEAAREYAYGNGSNCFLNSTEIGVDNVLMSVPASQILNAVGGVNGDVETMTNKLYGSMVAMNQMLELFYKERGFNPKLYNGTRGIPTGRFNVRYHRMFAGAFMYAGGGHLGIEWGSVPGLAHGSPVITDENGKRIGGNMFGWGIAHEMGHNADGAGVTYAEVTNNIWSQFEKTWDTAGTSRIPYAKVYSHVTSNTIGKPGNVFAQLGMYWQLHLAYDTNYAHYNYYQTPDENGEIFNQANYDNMLANEFFARYYLYRREPNAAPFSLNSIRNGTVDQNIMRTACAAAQKDLTDFFTAWGIAVDDVTRNYAAQYPKEERKIQYINDAAHEYTLAGGPEMTSTTVNAELVQGTGANARKVTLTISLPDEQNMDAILGYEIIRNGKAVAFITPDMVTDEEGTTSSYAAQTVYTDVVQTLNNRVMTYAVVAYDKYLNATAKTEMDPIKIRHEGDLPKDDWTSLDVLNEVAVGGNHYYTTLVSAAGMLNVYDGTKVEANGTYTDVKTNETVTYTEDMDVHYLDKDTGELLRVDSAVKRIFDGDETTTYKGLPTAGQTPQIIISLGGMQEVMGIARTPNTPEGMTRQWGFGIQFSSNGGLTWSAIGDVQAIPDLGDGRGALMFKTAGNVRAVKATHIRITPSGANWLGFEELSLLGPTGDNADIGISTVDEVTGVETWDTTNAIGILDSEYVLESHTDEEGNVVNDSVIPAGSFIDRKSVV